MKEKEIGKVVTYFAKAEVAAVEMTGKLLTGDKIHIKGSTTDFTQEVESMQIDNQKVDKVESGQSVGIKVKDRVRENDKVYKI